MRDPRDPEEELYPTMEEVREAFSDCSVDELGWHIYWYRLAEEDTNNLQHAAHLLRVIRTLTELKEEKSDLCWTAR